MKKKGIILNNVLSLIIAVIGLGILFFAAYKLYAVSVGQDSDAAKSRIDVIEAKINALEEGQTGKVLIQGIGKGDWFLTAWGKDVDMDLKPGKCAFDSCVCICKSEGGKSKKDSCQGKNGFCRKIDVEKLEVREYDIVGDAKGDVSRSSQYSDWKFEDYKVSYEPYFKFIKNNLYEATIRKKGGIIINHISELSADARKWVENNPDSEVVKKWNAMLRGEFDE